MLRPTPRRLVRYVLLTMLLATLQVPFQASPAGAVGEPSFKVSCAATRMAQDDPIVFPGRPGASHWHTFFGARQVTASSTVSTLLAAPESACGRNYGVDRSAYWVPTLFKRDTPVYATDLSVELAVYYRRAGGADGAPVDQAFPRGLRMIAGDMMASGPQDNVWYKCAGINDPGRQSKLGQTMPTCASDEELILELQFPDCWDGVHLDSADHKSHMAFSRGARATCPPSHPVKLPKMTYEVWYHGVNGPPSTFSLGWPMSAGTMVGMHGDVISAWEPRAFAGLVNECLNAPRDCTALRLDQISLASVTQQQIDAQLRPGRRSRPSRVRALRVAGSRHAPRRTVTWRAPRRSGTTPVVRYDVRLDRVGGGTLRRRHLTAPAHRLVLRTATLSPGRYRVLVRAANRHGPGPWRGRVFVVRR